MGINWELSDFRPEQRKKIMKMLADEDKRKKAGEDPFAYVPKDYDFDMGESDKQKRSKYGAEKITTTLYDGTEHTFDSKKEYRRYQELEVMQLAGEISDLKLQVKYELIPHQKLSNGKTERAVNYKADFVYKENGETVVEDVKGYRTPEYRIKKKLMLWVHKIEIREF